MKKENITLSILFLLSIAFFACNLEQEVDIDLPDFNDGIAIECYLEPGKPFRLLMTNTNAYFDPLPPLNEQFLAAFLIDSADVKIIHEGVTYDLKNQFSFDPDQIKFFNYISNDFVPESYDTPFELEIVTKEGALISSSTVILEPVPIDSVVIEFDDEPRNDTLFARALTYFNDDPDRSNFFRRMLHEGSLDSIPLQDFTVDDRFAEGRFVFGTQFIFAPGDTVINSIFHITEDYYNFLESTQNAINGNFNPFGQPSPIISNLDSELENVIGIFTGLSYDRIEQIVPE